MNSEVEQLHSRAESLFSMFQQGGGTSFIDDAIHLDREALALCPPGHPMRSVSLTCLATRLSTRYNQLTWAMQDLEEAIILDREALDLQPQGQLGRSTLLNNLAAHLFTRFKQLGVIADLNEAVVLAQEALQLCPQGHPDRSMSLYNLSICLSAQYNQLGEMADLNGAVVLAQEALHLFPQGHPDRSMSLYNLSICLSVRYSQLGVMGDLDEAVALAREAFQLCPQGHSDRSMSLYSLSICLSARYNQRGAMEDLNEAIVLDREALALRPQGHPDRSMSLNSLAMCLSTWYNQFGAMEDLNEAITLGREALDLCPYGHPNRSTSLNNLAICLSTRFHQLEAMEDLNEAIILDREALALRPQGHPNRSMSLNSFAICLSARYNQLGAIEDLNEAIALGREALALRPQGHPDRSMSLNNLAADLFIQHQQLGTIQDLDEAIVLGREALDLRPRRHPDWSASLDNLATYLCSRFTLSRHVQDKEELFDLYPQLAHVPQIVSSSDLAVALGWIRAAEDFQHSSTVLAYETSLRLLILHQATLPLPSLPRHLVALTGLTSLLTVDVFSVCLRNRAPARAVEFLEQGRGVLWSQFTCLRFPLDDRIEPGLMFADQLTRLASIICNALNLPGADQHERVYHPNLEMERVMGSVRKLPGLFRCLLPFHFSDLRRAASGGPVIIVNASTHSCDALIVFLDRDPVRIPLRITREDVRGLSAELQTLTTRAKRDDVTSKLASFLHKLWDQIVSPIVECLQTTHPSQSRIWWCPTAEFSVLPLHAAGPFMNGGPSLLDLYISSYTPTLTALIRARRRDSWNSGTVRKHIIAIGQAKADGMSELSSVGAELDSIQQHIDGLATFMLIDGEDACTSRVVEELGKNEWVHLACHALPNGKQPFESAFVLHDGHFTVQQIIKSNLENPEFAYLSASHTAVGDEESPDGVVHLASAMQFVGFRSVIGTTGAVEDGVASKVASTFYKHMVDECGRLDHTLSAFALNKTMRSKDIPLDQRILYIHLGA